MSTRSGGRLRRDTLSVVGSAAMAMAFMGPATSVAFNTQPAAKGAGGALPLSLLLALVACLLVANTIACFARKLPTAGFVYTFNTHGFGPSGGFLSGWLVTLGYGMVGPMLFAAFGEFGAQFLTDVFGWHVPWWVVTVVCVAVVWGINASGVSQSAKAALVFLVLEVGVILALGVTVLADGGAHGLSLAPFSPASSPTGVGGIGIGMLWGVLMFIGFESAATLGEEARSPKRTIPVALFTGAIVIGLFYVFSGYAVTVGHGAGLAGDDAPWITLAQHYWSFTWLIALTVLNSQFANLISGTSAAVRILFSMGREGILPSRLGRTGGAGVPRPALAAYMLFSLAFALGMGALLGPLGVYGFAGTILGLVMVVCYILMSIALVRFYRREHRAEFSRVRHLLLPVLTSVLMLLPIYGQVYPLPPWPNNLALALTCAWFLAGVGYLAVIRTRRPALLTAMGRVWEDDDTSGSDASPVRPAAGASGTPLP